MSKISLTAIKRDKLNKLNENPDKVNFFDLIIPAKQGITIFIKNWCGYSQKAMQELKNANKKFIFYDIENELNSDIVEGLYKFLELKEKIERRTVPQVLHGNTYVGGCDDLIRWLNKKK